METISVARQFDGDADQIRSVFGDVTTFFDAAGFDARRDDDRISLTKRVSAADVELDIRLRDDETAVLAYEQVDGPFEAMQARYTVDHEPKGSRLTIETSFETPASGFGMVLSTAVIERQREAEFHAVASLVEETGESVERATEDHGLQMGGS